MQDRLSEIYPPLSPYQYANNNPVKNIDVNGDYFTGETDKVKDLTNEAHNQITYQQNRIHRLESKLDQRAAAGQSTKGIQNRIDNAQNTITGLKDMLGEISTLAMSKQEYHIVNSTALNTTSGLETILNSQASFNFTSGAVDITFNGGFGSLAHELKHGYQFETGETSLAEPSGAPIRDGTLLLYDKYDEVEAYNRGSLFKGSTYTVNSLPQRYNQVPAGPAGTGFNVGNHPAIQQALQNPDPNVRGAVLQRVAQYYQPAFRIGSTTYH